MSYDIKQGNLEPALEAQLTDKDGTFIDTTGLTVDCTIRDSAGVVTNYAAITIGAGAGKPATSGWVSKIWGAGETDLPGDYLAEFHDVTGGRPKTFPSRDYVAFTIHPLVATTLPTDINWGQVAAFYDELACLNGTVTQAILSMVNDMPSAVWGGADDPRYKLARIHYAAHFGFGALPGVGEASGSVTSESIGGLSITYGTTTEVTDGELGSTRAGQNYLTLVKANALARLPMLYP